MVSQRDFIKLLKKNFFGSAGSSLLRVDFFSCGRWRGLLFIVVCRLLIAAASRVAEHGLQEHGLSIWGSCDLECHQLCKEWQVLTSEICYFSDTGIKLLHIWDPPRPGIKPVSSALSSRFFTTEPPGKPPTTHFKQMIPEN